MVLPFPFDAVESFFNNFFKQIQLSIVDLPGRVSSIINSILSAVKREILDRITSLPAQIYNQLIVIRDQIVGALVGLPGKIISLVGSITDQIKPIINGLTANFTKYVADIYNRLASFFGPIVNNLRSFIDQQYQNLTRFFSDLRSRIDQFIGPALTRIDQFVRSIPDQLNTQYHNFTAFLNDSSARLQAHVTNTLEHVNKWGQTLNNQVATVRADFALFSDNLQSQLSMLPQALEQLSSNLFGPLSNSLTSLKTMLLDPLLNSVTSISDITRKIIRPTGSITPEDAVTQLNTLGPVVLAAQGGIMAAAILGETLTLGQLDQVARAANDMMRQTGIDIFERDWLTAEYEIGVKPALTRHILRKYEPLIPGAADLVNMVVKEAFVDSFRTPAPELFAKYMQEAGFSRFWADTFWTAHWRPLEFGTATDLFHRGLIDRNELIRRFVILDYRPDDAPKLAELIFRLPNRVEARIMTRFGLLSDAQIDEILRAEGVREDYIPALRTMMSEFALTSIFGRTETTAISGYEDGLVNDSDFISLMEQIKRPKGVIDQDLKLAKYKRVLEFRRFQIKTISEAMDKGIITIEEGKKELEKIALDSEMVGLIVARSQFRLKILTPKDAKEKGKDLTVGQITAAVKKGVITPDAGINAILAKGYTSDEARVLIETALTVLK
jgi:hypothetical protein